MLEQRGRILGMSHPGSGHITAQYLAPLVVSFIR